MCIPMSAPAPEPKRDPRDVPLGDGLADRARLAIMARRRGDLMDQVDRAQKQ